MVVAAAEHGPPVEASVTWTLEGGDTATEQVTVSGDAAVLAAPFAWDGTFAPVRWSAAVAARWGDEVVEHAHRSQVICPTFAVWTGRVEEAGWEDWTADLGSILFPELVAPAVLSFHELVPGAPDAERVAHARATLEVGAERAVAFAYAAGGPVSLAVDGTEVDADPAGTGPVPFYTLRSRAAPERAR